MKNWTNSVQIGTRKANEAGYIVVFWADFENV